MNTSPLPVFKSVLVPEFQRMRKQGVPPADAVKEMIEWRKFVIERLLKRAEIAGLPSEVQSLIADLNVELTALHNALLRVVS